MKEDDIQHRSVATNLIHAHFSILSAAESQCNPESNYVFVNDYLIIGGTQFFLDTSYCGLEGVPNYANILDICRGEEFDAVAIDQIAFDLLQFKGDRFNPLIEYTRHCKAFRLRRMPLHDGAAFRVLVQCYLDDECTDLFCEAAYMEVERKPFQDSLFAVV